MWCVHGCSHTRTFVPVWHTPQIVLGFPTHVPHAASRGTFKESHKFGKSTFHLCAPPLSRLYAQPSAAAAQPAWSVASCPGQQLPHKRDKHLAADMA
mmetsp:Transcript_44640/g.80045  ORF Transcript_44640/g.80045 Transcript_44640/m.80045 type:complete len:97 (+) Transcript_44640:1708-1998(+)